MTLVCNGRIERRTELLSILSFRLKDAVMDEKGQAGKDALICIILAEGQLVIALEKLKAVMNGLFIISCRLCGRTG